MAGNNRSQGVWKPSNLLFADDEQWSEWDDNAWMRDAGVWVQIQPAAGTGSSAIRPVENLRLDPTFADNPTSNQAYVTWDLPPQVTQPNILRIRVLAISDIWMTYPATTIAWSHLALASDTAYTIDVQLALQDGPTIVAFSTIRSLSFTTDPYAPGDPTIDPGPGDEPIIPIPPPPGGGGPVGGSLCWWGVKLQEYVPGTNSWTTIQEVQIDGDLTHYTPPYNLMTPGRDYRICLRDICPGPVYGAYVCYPSWPYNPNMTTPCSIHTDNRWGTSPYTDAIFIIPKFCGDGTVRDVVSNIALSRGPLYAGSITGPLGNSTKAISVGGISNLIWDDVAMGALPNASNIGPNATLNGWIFLDGDMEAGDEQAMIIVAGEIMVGVRGGVLGNQPWAWAYTNNYNFVEVQGTTAFTEGEWVSIGVTFDSTADLITVYLRGQPVGTVAWTGVVSLNNDDVRVRGGAGGGVAYLTGWDRVLTPIEMGVVGTGLSPYDVVVIADGPIAYWPLNDLDPASYGDYDNLILTEGQPIAYWKLNQLDPIFYASYDVAVLADDPVAFWPLNDIDTV